MLMIGRLMFGNRSMGRRPSATKPSSAMASDAIKTAIELRRARNVSHMLLSGLRADALTLAHQLLALDDHLLLALEAPHDLDQGALALAGRDRAPADHALFDHEHRGGLTIDRDRLVRHQQRARMMIDHELDAGVHPGLEQDV